MDLLKTELFAGFTVLQVGGTALTLILLVVVYKGLFSKKQERSHLVEVSCECGWRGKVGKFNPVCRKCNKKL